MQFRAIFIGDYCRFAWALTKHEVAAFHPVMRAKKAPLDERVIRFTAARGAIWATDREQLLCVEAKSDYEPKIRWPHLEFAVLGAELKSFGPKIKNNELLIVDSTRQVHVTPKVELYDDFSLRDSKHLGELDDVRDELALDERHLEHVLAQIPANDGAGVGSFFTSARWGHTLSAVAKATSNGEAVVFTAPATATSGMRWVIADEVDGARWQLIAMPLHPREFATI